MSVISTPAIKTDINTNIFQNSSQLITGTILNGVLINIADSYLNKVTGGLLMQVETGYTSLLTLVDDKSFTHKKYVDDSVAGLLPTGLSTQYYRGDKSLGVFQDDVRSTLLTGLGVFVSTPIVHTMSILESLSALQGQINSFSGGGIASLNGLIDSIQTFSTGTSGTDFNISSALSVHIFNIPTASATNRGALSSSDWTSFNNKQPALGFTPVSEGGTYNDPIWLNQLAWSKIISTPTTLSGYGITDGWNTLGNAGSGLKIGTTTNNTWDAIANGNTVVRFATPINGGTDRLHICGGGTGGTDDPCVIQAVGTVNSSIALRVGTNGNVSIGNYKIYANTIDSSSNVVIKATGNMQLQSNSAISLNIYNNFFNVNTGANGGVTINASITASSGNFNIMDIGAGMGPGSGAINGIRLKNNIGVGAAGSYTSLNFAQTTTGALGAITHIASTLGAGSNRAFINHSGDAQSIFGGNINLTGSAKIKTYAGNSTIGNGVLSVLGKFSVVGRTTGAYTAEPIMTIPSTGDYEVTVMVNYQAGSSLWLSELQLNYTSGGSATTHNKTNKYTTDYRNTETYLISCDATTTLSFSTVLLGATTHDILIYVKRIG